MLTGYEEEGNNILQCERREGETQTYVNGELQVGIHDQYNSKKGKSGNMNKKGRKLCDKTKSLFILL